MRAAARMAWSWLALVVMLIDVGGGACYLSKVICTSIVSVRASPNTVASRA